MAKLDGHTGPVSSVVALQDNVRALSAGGFDMTLRLWDLNSLSCIKTIVCGREEADAVFATAVNREGNQALSGHRGGDVRLWSLETCECLATMLGHSDNVRSIQVTADGHFAVSGSDDKTVKVWDLETMICTGTLEGHEKPVNSVAISADGTLIASTGFTDRTVRLWDWKSGACLQVITLEGQSAYPLSVAFDPTGSRLLAGTYDGEIDVYRLSGVLPAPPADATRRYLNAKVVLIGESTVGKTSLAHRLVEDR